MLKKEIRTTNIENLNTREGEKGESIIGGYAAIFNSPAEIDGYFKEEIATGAFTKALSDNQDIRALFNHDWNHVLGRTKAGTLQLFEDDRGLKFEVYLPNTSLGRDLKESLQRGDISQCSFGFIPIEEQWDYSTEPITRTIIEVELYEISVVSIPAYEDTEVNIIRGKELNEQVSKRMQLVEKIKETLEEM